MLAPPLTAAPRAAPADRSVEADVELALTASDNDAALRLCPGIYQACVRKRYDLRVTVIGRRMFDITTPLPSA